MNLLEIIGYLATVLIAISLMMKSMVKLRWINLFGASTFATYGYLIDAYPVLVLNGSITIIDIIYLFQMYYKKDYFEIFQVKSFQASAFFKVFWNSLIKISSIFSPVLVNISQNVPWLFVFLSIIFRL